MTMQHWQEIEQPDDVVFWALDKSSETTNTINAEVLTELDELITKAEEDPALKGIVIMSAKPSGFIFGADIRNFTTLQDEAAVVTFIEQGQRVFQRLAQLSCPTVAFINGICVGGGLELALACRYRIVGDDSKIRLGLPEVKLGIIPGWRGSVALPRLVGSFNALPLIMAGTLISAQAAMKIGLVDVVVPERHWSRAALSLIHKAASSKPRRFLWSNFFCQFFLVRRVLASIFRKKLAKKIDPKHYPASFAVIDNWEKHFGDDKAGYQAEVNTIKTLMLGDTAKELIRIFFLQDEIKHMANSEASHAKHVHVIGAGVMGADIASWCALQGLRVTLQDLELPALANAKKRAYELFKKKLKNKYRIDHAMDQFILDPDGIGLPQADVVIEAIVEKCEAKQDVFKKVEQTAKPSALLATNTSSIPLHDISTVMTEPARLVGLHFFNPVPQMQLLEIVKGHHTDATIVQRAIEFARSIDKLPIPVKDTPGFLVNRILFPYLAEAFRMVEEGIELAQIDRAATQFGMPMGPIELADTVGLDICVDVGKHVQPDASLPECILSLVKKGHLGRKTGRGFYRYHHSKIKRRKTPAEAPSLLTDRLILAMVNESYLALNEGIVEKADWLDAAMIFGTGFAPCHGGPIHYAETLTLPRFKQRLDALKTAYGERFTSSV